MELRNMILALGIALLLLAGCTATAQQPANTATNGSGGTNMAKNTTDTGGSAATEIAVFETNRGNFEIELDRAHAPKTVENFVTYVKSGFYDGLVFHRVIGGFMIQGGGFGLDQSQKQANAPIALESANGLKNTIGTVAMARTSDPNSATSQFFINVADNDFLNYGPGNPGYAVFGKVVSGMDNVMAISKVPTTTKGDYSDWPVQDVVITKAYMKG